MTIKINIIIISSCLLIAAAGLAWTFTNPECGVASLVIDLGLGLGQLFGMVMLLQSGTLIRTGYLKVILVFTGLVIIGALIKIMHWPGASQLLTASCLGIMIVYLLHFIAKTRKNHLDILKLLWVLSAYASAALLMLHYIPGEAVYIPQVILWLTIADFLFMGLRAKPLNEKQNPGTA